MLRYSIKLLIHYLKFADVPTPYPNNSNYSGFRSYEVHLSPLIACGEGVRGGVLVPHNTKEVLYQTTFEPNLRFNSPVVLEKTSYQ